MSRHSKGKAKLRTEPLTFSATYGLTKDDMLAAGAVDVTLNCDTKLFVDPLLLSSCSDREFSNAAMTAYRERFDMVVDLLANSTAEGDKAWKAAKRLLSFPEMPMTQLGYSGGRPGSGFGELLTDTLILSAQEVIGLGVKNPHLFVALALFEEGVGADRISDMTCGIIISSLIGFTERVAARLNVDLEEYKLERFGITARLPPNPHAKGRSGVILVPSDIVRDLPVASDWDSVATAARETQDLRDRVNAQIGDIWAAKSKRAKQRFRQHVVANRQAFDLFLSLIEQAADDSYDVKNDHNGELYPSDLKTQVQREFPLDLTSYRGPDLGAEAGNELVRTIIEQFRQLIEQNGLWRLLWNEEQTKSRREKAAQLIFFATALSYCEANNLDVTPEADAGAGPVDFKISQGNDLKILVELKKSTNRALLSGYTEQLEAYKASEKTVNAHYVVIDFGNLKPARRAALLTLRDEAAQQGKASEIWFVDGTTKVSASNR